MDTPLHYVVRSKHSQEIKLQLVQILLRYGANCTLLGKDEETSIDAAYSNYWLEAVDLMRESLGMMNIYMYVVEI